MFSNMQSFSGDYYGKRCLSGEQSGDIFNDYLDILYGVACHEIKWRLHYFSTDAEYASWEHLMLQGFYRCNTYEHLDDSTRLVLTLRRVDEEVARWWDEEMCEKDIIDATWYDFSNFLRGCFVSSS